MSLADIVQTIRYLLRPPVFEITLSDSQAQLKRGKVKPRFIKECLSLSKEAGVQRGKIYGVKKGQSVALDFSSSIPDNCRQRLRNVWNLH